VHALYGLKSAGASFRNHLADCMTHLGFTPCLDDPDLWMRPEVHPSDGVSYYAYVLLYVDDVSVVHHDATDVLLRLDKYFKMKPGSIGDPDVYLGATIKQMRLANGVMAWASSPSRYVRASVDAVTKYLTNLGDRRWSMPKKAANPFPGDYEPEPDTTQTLNPELSSWYASLIRMLQWMVNHGGIKIASQMSSPREGHLDALLHILVSSESTTTLGWRTTHRMFSNLTTGKVFMETLRSQSPATRRNRVERMSIYDCTLTATMLGRSTRPAQRIDGQLGQLGSSPNCITMGGRLL
jgi:hypothetical protein